MKINIPAKQNGELLQAGEVNQMVIAINETDIEAKTPSHYFSDDFIEDGTEDVDGVAVPVIKVNRSKNKKYFDSTQFDGDGSSAFPYKIKDNIIGGGAMPTLNTPVPSVTNITQTTATISWPSVLHAEQYILQRALNSGFGIDLQTLQVGNQLSFADTGLIQNTNYWYRVIASATGYVNSIQGVINMTTQAAGAITPTPPTVIGDDDANTLKATHATLQSEIVVSTNGSPYVAYTGDIMVGDVARPVGYWTFKIKSAPGRNESSVVNSPEFTKSIPDDAIHPLIFANKDTDVSVDSTTNTYTTSGTDVFNHKVWGSGKKLALGVNGSVYLKDSINCVIGMHTSDAATYFGNMTVCMWHTDTEIFAVQGGGPDFVTAKETGYDYRINRTGSTYAIQKSNDNWVTNSNIYTYAYTGTSIMYALGDIRNNTSSLVNPRYSSFVSV